MVEYRGALECGGACWTVEDGLVRCYAGTDVNGSAHIDYSFAATVRGPYSHDLFACEARNCLHDVLELVIDAVPHARLPLIVRR
jgi:hypothetical protein